MALEVILLDSIESANKNQWNHVIEESLLGRVYHRYEWLRLIEAGTPFEPRHLLVSKKNNPIAVFPNFVTSIEKTPFYRLVSNTLGSLGALGPVVLSEEETAMQLLLEAIPQLCDGRIISHLIKAHDQDHLRYHKLLDQYGYERNIGYCYLTLDISRDWEQVATDMHSSRRRAIRKGHEQEFEVVDIEITRQTLSDLHETHSSVMDRVEGDKTSLSLFQNLTTFSERIKVFSLRVNGKERGKLLFVLDDEQSTIHYLFSAVTEEQFEYNSSELLHEYAIKWGIENGYETYNFGGTDPDFRDGLFRFKERFGATVHAAPAWERGYSTILWPVVKTGRHLSHRLTS